MTMRFRAHDTFYIRKGWLSKGMKNIVQKPNVFVDKNENPMDVLGIGANMVKALRYWLPAVGLTEEATSGVRTQKLTGFGRLVFKNDKFIEDSDKFNAIMAQTPLKKWATCEEIADWIYMLSVINSSCSGQDIIIDNLESMNGTYIG